MVSVFGKISDRADVIHTWGGLLSIVTFCGLIKYFFYGFEKTEKKTITNPWISAAPLGSHLTLLHSVTI